MNRVVFAGATALLLFGFAARSEAAVIYNNGGPNQKDALSLSDFETADDFTLAGGFNVTDVRFWNVQGTAADYQGSINWFIYANSGGTPGAVIASGLATTVTRVATGSSCCGGFTEFQNDFSIGSVALGAGTYWLGLHDGPIATHTFFDFYWETSSNVDPNSAQALDLVGGGGFQPTGLEMAYLLQGTPQAGVPEPGTILLLGGGLVTLGLLRFRKAQ